jgi:hypothetical protein
MLVRCHSEKGAFAYRQERSPLRGWTGESARPHTGTVSLKRKCGYNNIPAIDADIRFAIVPASMARTPSLASSPRLFGARAPMPPI